MSKLPGAFSYKAELMQFKSFSAAALVEGAKQVWPI